MMTQLVRLRVIMRQAVRRAPVSRSAPSSCPTTMAVALPNERNTSLKIWAMVLQMFSAATA